MIQKLDFAEPFFRVDYVEHEAAYPIEKQALVLNMGRSEADFVGVRPVPVKPLRSTIVMNGTLEIEGRALVIHDYQRKFRIEDEEADAIKKVWKSLWEYSHLERNRGVRYYKSPRTVVGGDTGMNFCLAEANIPSAIHREHGENFDEVHLLVWGTGRVQLLYKEDQDTVYQEFPLAPGNVNDPVWDENGNYPWHRYYSESRCIFVVVERNRKV